MPSEAIIHLFSILSVCIHLLGRLLCLVQTGIKSVENTGRKSTEMVILSNEITQPENLMMKVIIIISPTEIGDRVLYIPLCTLLRDNTKPWDRDTRDFWCAFYDTFDNTLIRLAFDCTSNIRCECSFRILYFVISIWLCFNHTCRNVIEYTTQCT